MSGVEQRSVAEDEADLRLDRWFRRHFPDLPHGQLEKLLRTGKVRIDGKRAKANARLNAGQTIRVPPVTPPASAEPATPKKTPQVAARDSAWLQSLVLHRDADMIVINKPAGLAVQGGTGVTRSLDGMLDALRFGGAERPRLVHRLDRDTSGVLVLARSARVAARLSEAFRTKAVRKLYWALVVGVPRPHRGRIDLPLAKVAGLEGERVVEDDEGGKRAITEYAVVDHAGKKAAWLALEPLTGRTHQLRVHCLSLGTPILGDGKYGGPQAFLSGAFSRDLHLHARAIVLPLPDGTALTVRADLPDHMRQSWEFFGFDAAGEGDTFAERTG
ncbi:MAG: RluA family pseudouridine synthase [Rhodospirillaceae bacterium]|nr:RluA family pseudouridine synthase [Rhodospirillaceae bacterium]